MKYLIFKNKTETADGEFAGVIDAQDFAAAKKLTKQMDNCHCVAATFSVIEWFKNDAKVRISKTNSLPADFDLKTAKKLN